MRVAPGLVLACAVLLCRAPVHAVEDSSAPTEGKLSTRDGKDVVDVPLKHTKVGIHVTGFLADVEVEQVFQNPYKNKIEATYLFPLPSQAAVNGMQITTGGQTIEGQLKKRADATQAYKAALVEGRVAALLTEERPNLFTQSVANIEPGAQVVVKIHYLQALPYEDGGYEVVFPMVAAPRYVPQSSKLLPAEVAAVQPSVLPPGLRSSHDIEVAVDLEAGVPVQALASPSHRVVIDARTPQTSRVTLAAGDTIPNKDFILKYQVAGKRPDFAVLAHKGPGEAAGSFFFMAQPPADATAAEVTPRELVFVIDTSSSMAGRPLAKAKEAVRRALKGLGPEDTFQIVRFSDAASALGARPIANKAKNVDIARTWLDGLTASGGTDMSAGIKAALDFPHDPARLRIVAFLTDGYIGNEDEVLALVQEKLGASRLFSFGVGSAVNRYLLEEMAALGRGAVQVVRPDEDTTVAVEKFYQRIARPVLTDVRIDWGKLAVADVTPAAVPDLFVGQPIVLSGHYRAAGAGTVTVRGMAGGRPVAFQVPVKLPETAPEHPAVPTVWARARIAELSRQQLRGSKPAIEAEIVELALAHRLVTPYTAFVAVDTSRVTGGGKAETVAVPVEVPEGMQRGGGGGGGGGTGAAMGEAYGSMSGAYAADAVGGGGGGGGGHAPMVAGKAPSPAPPPVEHMLLEPAREAPARPSVVGKVTREDAERGPTATARPKDEHAPTRSALAAHKAEIARCSETAGFHGELLLHVDVGGDGKVKSWRLPGSVSGNKALQSCVSESIKTWALPAAAAALDYAYQVE